MTPEFEARLQKAVDDGIIPGAILLARDKSGLFFPFPPFLSPPVKNKKNKKIKKLLTAPPLPRQEK